MANTIEKVLSIAEAEKGYLEKKNSQSLDDKTVNAGDKNYTKYWRDLNDNMQGEPWCQAFVNWCFMKAYGKAVALRLLNMSVWSYYTPTAAGYFKNKNQWHTSAPKAGDIIFFKNSTRIHHVGIIKAVKGTTITTIEGNTSSSAGVVANGGGVFEKTYQISDVRIAGFGRPKYDEVSEEIKLGWIQSGDKWYYRLEAGVNAHGWQRIKNADGKTRWYHFTTDGAMDTGIITLNGCTYYLLESGDLEGACCKTNESGVLLPWVVE